MPSFVEIGQPVLKKKIFERFLPYTGRPVTFGVKNIGQVQKYRFFEAKNIGLNRMYIE